MKKPRAKNKEWCRFGAAIRKARIKRGLSCEQFARRVGCVPMYVYAIESGRVAPPSWRFLRSFCAALRLKYPRMLAEAWWAKRPKDLKLLDALCFLRETWNG